MSRNLVSVVGYALILLLSSAASVRAAEFGTAEEAKAMLEKAVIKEDKGKALDMIDKRARAATRTVIFTCPAPTLRTALSRRIRT